MVDYGNGGLGFEVRLELGLDVNYGYISVVIFSFFFLMKFGNWL